MLKALFGLCKRGNSCAKTPEEETERLRKVFLKSKYDIAHFPESHALYQFYSKYLVDHSNDFANVVCRNQIMPKYIVETQEDNPILTIARTLDNEGKIVYSGFAQSQLDTDDDATYTLHILTICTIPGSSLGKAILDSLELYIKSQVKLKFITLNSIAESLEFYEKMGFEYDEQESDSEYLFPMTKTVGGYKKTTRRRLTKQKKT